MHILFIITSLFLIFFSTANVVNAASFCGELTNAFGPFDYRDPAVRRGTQGNPSPLLLVEGGHFSSTVEGLIKGMSGADPLGDIDYTLRAFPNHPRALHSIARYERQKIKEYHAKGKTYIPPHGDRSWPASAECYFDRAIRWRPDDPNVRLVYGIHLHLLGRLNEALQQYKISEKIQPNVADLQYNLGLLYFDMKQYALAKEHAKKAYQLGYPLPGLRKKLVSVGQWP